MRTHLWGHDAREKSPRTMDFHGDDASWLRAQKVEAGTKTEACTLQ